MSTLIDFIGNTPLVELRHINPNKNVRLMAKLEGQNPGGSVKDRTALGLIQGGTAGSGPDGAANKRGGE
jgi:cysteine synthase B